jgi:hypothetical protein
VWDTKYCNNNRSDKSGMGWPIGKIFDDSTLKKVFLGKPDGRRKAGRPKFRWLDSLENDLE